MFIPATASNFLKAVVVGLQKLEQCTASPIITNRPFQNLKSISMNPKRILLALISVVSMFYIGCSISGPAHANGTAQQSDDKPKQVKIGGIQWYVDYDAALKVAKEKKKPIWLHFGENPG